jgi:hypothetical protein
MSNERSFIFKVINAYFLQVLLAANRKKVGSS